MKNKSLFSRFLQNKKVLFIVSVIFAFIFWILTADNITKTFTDIPLKYNLPESVSQELEIFSSSNQTVSVTVDGKRVAVDALGTDSFTATIDLSNVTEAGEKSYEVNVKCSANNNLDISKIEPSNVTLMIDKPMTKTVEVKHDFSYKPVGYYVVDNTPDTVEISGPESYVNQVKCAYITGVVNSPNASSVTNNYKIALYDNENPHSNEAKVIDNEYITLSYTNVDVTFRYLKVKEDVPFSIKNNEGISIDNRYFSTSPKTINVAVPESILDENGELTFIPIDIGSLSAYRNEIYSFTTDVVDILDKDMINKSEGIEKISCRLDFSSLQTKTIEVPASRCIANNLPSGYNYDTTEKFSFVVVGTKEALDSINPEKVDISFDFETVKPSGEQYVDVPVSVTLNGDGLCWAYSKTGTYSVRMFAE